MSSTSTNCDSNILFLYQRMTNNNLMIYKIWQVPEYFYFKYSFLFILTYFYACFDAELFLLTEYFYSVELVLLIK